MYYGGLFTLNNSVRHVVVCGTFNFLLSLLVYEPRLLFMFKATFIACTVSGTVAYLPQRFSSTTFPVHWNILTISLIYCLLECDFLNFRYKSFWTCSYIFSTQSSQNNGFLLLQTFFNITCK